RELRFGFELLGELGEAGFRSTVASLLADVVLRKNRDDEVEELLKAAESLAQPDDLDLQVRTRTVRARLLARRGEVADAVRLAREAVDLVSPTDYVGQHGDALVALAEVLRAAGAAADAAAALRDALELFERKENVV